MEKIWHDDDDDDEMEEKGEVKVKAIQRGGSQNLTKILNRNNDERKEKSSEGNSEIGVKI